MLSGAITPPLLCLFFSQSLPWTQKQHTWPALTFEERPLRIPWLAEHANFLFEWDRAVFAESIGNPFRSKKKGQVISLSGIHSIIVDKITG